ncbi:MAG TPA: dynamin family protein, partial [Planctomycetota bacterium]|nr:dynamin family protein [Planctomycetota bacterium]
MLGQILPEEAIAAAERERALLERVLSFAGGFDTSEAQRVRDLIAHLEEMFLLVVVGEVKAGKSAFINALLGVEACPEGPLPLTDRVHVLAYGETAGEQAPEPHVVRRTLPIEHLRRMNVVDTPGTNSPLKRHQQITEAFLPRADIVFFVTSIDCPFTQTDVRFLGKVRERWKKEIACVLAKVDMRSDEDRAAVTDYLKATFRDLLGFTPPIFAVSSHIARDARRAGDEARLEASGIPAVERYIVENLSEGRRVMLKLKSPLGTVLDVLRRAEATGAGRLRALEQDFAGWKVVEEQAQHAAGSLKERAERQIAPIAAAFEGLETRGCAFLRDRIRLRHMRLLGDAGRFRAEFERDVVRGIAEEIEVKVEAVASWLAGETRALWQRSLEHFHRTVALSRYREEIPSGGSLSFRETQQGTLDRIVGNARRDLASWSAESECRRVRDLASRSLARLLGIEAAAAGLGAAAVTALGASLGGLVGVAVAAGVALRGFFLLPSRREQAVVRFEEGV